MKVLKIIFIVILAILLLLIITPLIFKSKIIETVKTEVNKTVNATVEFQDVKLSLFKSFPDFFFGLYDLSVVGKDEFLNDTIFAFSSVQLNINLASVIGGDQIKINLILIDKPVVNAIVLKNGKANWDIVETEPDTVQTDTVTEESTSAFSLGLKEFLINNATIIYNDEESNIHAEISNLVFAINGDFTQDFTKIMAELSIEQLSFKMDGIKYLNKASISYTAGLDADLNNNKFTFNENIFKLNEIKFGLDGFVEMPDEDITMDLKFDLKETKFKDLLSLIPIVYKTDFENVETHGEFSFNGFAKGVYNDSLLPAFNLSLLVNNAMFKYPDLPDAVDHINIDINVKNPGGDEDNTVINVNRLKLREKKLKKSIQ